MYRRKLNLILALILAMVASSSAWAQQFAHPDGTIGSTADYTFNTVGHWEDVGEGQPADDGTFIQTTINPGAIEFSLSDGIVNPGIATGHILKFRSINTSNNNKNVTITLLEGGSTVGSTTILVVKKTNSWTEFTYTIPSASVGIYNDLSFRISGAGTPQAPVQISWIELEVPAATIIPPTVTTLAATTLADDGARLNGEVNTDGTPSANRGFDWGTSTGNYDLGSQSVGSGAGQYFLDVSGLGSDTEFFFRAWADNGTPVYGGELSFTTLPAVALATVTVSVTVTSIAENSATLSGEVTADGGGTVSASGIVWDTVASPELSPTKTFAQLGSGVAPFAGSVGNLPAGATIYYEAYATNSAGTAYSNSNYSFSTLAGLATVATRAVENITATTADLGGDVTNNGGATVTDKGIVWNTTTPPEIGGTIVSMGSSTGPFISTVGDNEAALPTGVLVYFRAYATNSEGTAYSDIQTFTPAGPPVVSSSQADVTHNSALLGGNVSADGGSAVTGRGIEWDTDSSAPYANQVPMGAGLGFFSQTVTLPSGSTIYFRAYADNAGDTGYSGEDTLDTPSEPTVQATFPTFPRFAGRSIRIAWTRGNGDGSIVVLRQGVTKVDPVDGTDYAADPDYALAAEIAPNNFVVHKGPENTVWITGLVEDTSYSVAIYEYAGTGATTDYLQLNPAEGSQATTSITVHNEDNRVDCNDCHYHGTFGARDVELKAVCVNCHEPFGEAKDRLEFDNHLVPNKNLNVDFVDCGVCHELHMPGGSNTTESVHSVTSVPGINKSYLRANVDKYISTAVTPAYLYADDQPLREGDDRDAPLDALTPDRAVEGGTDAVDPATGTQARGYCQVCHTKTNYHTNNPAISGSLQTHDGDQNTSGLGTEVNCGNCHKHDNRFAGVGGTVTCIECHDQPQGTVVPRPIITTQFNRNSTHITGGDAVVTQEDCEVCHDQTGHPGDAIVGLLDADDGVTLFEQLTAGGSTTDPAEAKPFDGHCLSCHDDGIAGNLPASGSAQTQASPFTGSNAPPVIDETAWDTASHNRSSTPIMGCVGGCHGSGHGSEQNALLAPAATGPASSMTAFCYSCHSSGGISSFDIEAEFTTATNWPVTSASGAPVDQKHDLTLVGCADCHSPHTANSSSPVANPDTGAAIPLYDFNNYGVGLDPLNPAGNPSGGFTEPDFIEFCVVCHDGSPAPGVPGTMVDMSVAYFTNDQHGTSDGNGSGNGFLKPPFNTGTGEPPDNYAALNCTTCHGPHGSDNIFNLRSSINIAGTDMTVGGWLGDTIGEDPLTPGVARVNQTVYTMPLIGGTQSDHNWGAWCSFCHQIESHGKDEDVNCTSGHMHGAKQF